MFGVLIIRILLFRVLYLGPLFSETPVWLPGAGFFFGGCALLCNADHRFRIPPVITTSKSENVNRNLTEMAQILWCRNCSMLRPQQESLQVSAATHA